ncbi:MAG: PAS domain S-box protein [Proteobacteria bacterium]|nr:PAS domain S-box protein [Pseudomonadota bacterium]
MTGQNLGAVNICVRQPGGVALGSMLRCLSLFVLACLILPGISLGDEVIFLSGAQESYSIAETITISEDKQGQWTIDDVSAPAFADQFKPIPEAFRRPNYTEVGVSGSVWWLRLTVRADDMAVFSKDWILAISNPYFIGQIDCYFPSTTSNPQSPRSGWLTQGLNTYGPKPDDKRYFFELPLVNSAPQTIYLRVESDYYIILQPAVSTVAHRLATRRQSALTTGLFFSIIIVIGIFNLFVFLWLKDRSSFWHLLFVVSVGYYFTVTSRLGASFSTARFLGPMSFAYLQFIGISVITITCVLFIRSFLHTRKYTPRLHGFLTGYLWLNIITTLALPLLELDYEIGMVVAQWFIVIFPLLTPFATIIPGVVRLRQGFKPAKLYLVAWGIFGVGAFIFALPFDIPNTWFIFKIGCSINVTLLAFALVSRHRTLRTEKEALASARDTAEAALGKSEERFRTLANATTAHIAIVQNSQLVYANATFIKSSGMTWEQLKQAPLTDIFSPETLETAGRARVDAENQNRKQFRYETQDRAERRFEVCTRLVEIDGEDALISTSFDITERKIAEHQMFRAQKMASLGQIIAGVAHEINNPNNFIFFNLPILQKYIDSIKPILDERAEQDKDLRLLNMSYDMFIEDIYKLLENMRHGSKRITDIVSDLKNYVRSSETEDKKPEPLDGVFKQVMTLVGKQVRKGVKTFDVELADSLPCVKMNTGKIEQVLINLVINAGQAADKEESWVKLTAHPVDRDWVEILVEDNGSGISEENLENIFEPYFTTKADESGTGLGLAISCQIIEDHGGTIDVTSELGKGTKFAIRLPVCLT